MTDWLGMEKLIVDRLKAKVPALLSVQGASEIGALLESSSGYPTPAADVIYANYVVEEFRLDNVSRVTQTWYVVVRGQSRQDPITGAAVRGQVGPIVSSVLQALLFEPGSLDRLWQPGGEYKPLRLVSAPPHELFPDVGVLQFPLAFNTELIVKPNPGV